MEKGSDTYRQHFKAYVWSSAMPQSKHSGPDTILIRANICAATGHLRHKAHDKKWYNLGGILKDANVPTPLGLPFVNSVGLCPCSPQVRKRPLLKGGGGSPAWPHPPFRSVLFL